MSDFKVGDIVRLNNSVPPKVLTYYKVTENPFVGAITEINGRFITVKVKYREREIVIGKHNLELNVE